MKTLLSLFQCLALLLFLTACSGNNANLYLDPATTQQGSSTAGGDVAGGGDGLAGGGTVGGSGGIGGGSPPSIDKICQHPDAVNFSTASGEAGECEFVACTDNSYSESLKQADYQAYIDQYGGSIISDKSLCKTKHCEVTHCRHPEAVNFYQYGTCEFVACTNSAYLEYHTYAAYTAYVAKNGGNIDHDQSLCHNLRPVSGCTVSSAIEPDPLASLDDCSCKWKVCLDSKYAEFAEANNQLKLQDIDKYIAEHGGARSDYITASSCENLIPIPGCLSPKADNYNPVANTEDKSCKFSYCADVSYKEFDLAESKEKHTAAVQYASSYALELSTLSINTCATKKVKCVDPRATNNGKYEICHYKVCGDPKYEEYSLYQEIIGLVSQGKATLTLYADECKTLKPIYGCKESSAENYDSTATHENKTCYWKEACLDSDYEEYSDAGNQSLISIVNTYASTNGLSAADLVRVSTCKTKKVVKGCTDQNADNYNSLATQENYSCKFNLCGDCQYSSFDKPENLEKIQQAHVYAGLYSLSFYTVVGASTCSDPHHRAGCMNPLALNYDPGASVESRNCKFQSCHKCDDYQQFPEYSAEIDAIIAQYGKDYHVSPRNVNTCGTEVYTIRVKFEDSCLNKIQVAKVKVSFPNTSKVYEKYLTTPQPELQTFHVKKGHSYEIESLTSGYTINGQSSYESTVDGHKLIQVTCE